MTGSAGPKPVTHTKLYSFFLILFIITISIFLYPLWADSLADYKQTIRIGGYTDDSDRLTDTEALTLKSQAEAYNAQLWEKQQYQAFHYEGAEYTDPLYDQVLRVSSASQVMAYLEIPKADIYLPVVHGTKAEDLMYQAGHMHGTSVPVGGSNTHSVISAHTGLRSASLFDGIDKLEEHDQVYLHVLNETRIYAVTARYVVLPEHTDSYLQIEKGKDLLTLFTCTPYGINSHRLLVKCEFQGRIEQTNTKGGMQTAEMKNRSALCRFLLISLLPVFVAGFGLWRIRRKQGGKTC